MIKIDPINEPAIQEPYKNRKIEHIKSNHYPYNSADDVKQHDRPILSNNANGSLTIYGPGSMKLYLLDKTHILFIGDRHIVPKDDCAVPEHSEVLWVHNFIDTILKYSGPTMFFMEHGLFYKIFKDGLVDVEHNDRHGIGKTRQYFDVCLRNEIYDCTHTIHSINNMEFRVFQPSKYNLALSTKVYLINFPIYLDRHLIPEIDLDTDSTIFDFIYLYFYKILSLLSMSKSEKTEYLDRSQKQKFELLLKTLKNNYSNLLDALFNNDVDNFIDCLLNFILSIGDDIISKQQLNILFKTDEAKEIYKKILKQLSSESIYDKKSNSELLDYFKSKIDDIIDNTLLEMLIFELDKLLLSNYYDIYTYIIRILEYLKGTYINIGASIFDIYNLKRYLRQMPTDESDFKLVIIYAGIDHTTTYIDFFNNTRRQDFIPVIETNVTDDGCTTLTIEQLDKLNKILGYIKNQYKDDSEELRKFLNEEPKMTVVNYKFKELYNYNLRDHISLIKKNITKLKGEIFKIQQTPNFEILSEYRLKTELLKYLILDKKQLLLKYVKSRNELRNQKKIILQNPQETTELDMLQTVASAAVSSASPKSAIAAAVLSATGEVCTSGSESATNSSCIISGGNYHTWFHHCY